MIDWIAAVLWIGFVLWMLERFDAAEHLAAWLDRLADRMEK